jgi:type II secretory pathway component GspD/PulD (secretin)
MRTSAVRLGMAALFLSSAFGQNSDRVLAFSQTNTPQGYQEIANLIAGVAEVRVSPNAVQKTLAISGAPDYIAAAAWLFNQFDAPAAPGQSAPPQQYTMTGVNDNNLRVYRLVNIKTPTGLQELVNATRSVLEINRMFPLASQNAIALRATQSQVAAADFLIGHLDQPSEAPPPGAPAQYRYQPVNNQPAGLISICYMKYAQSPMQLQEAVNAARSLAEVNRMFPYSPLKAIVVRDQEGKVGAVEWLIQQLDRPVVSGGQGASGAPAMSEYRMQGDWRAPGQPGDQDVMRLFRLANAATPQIIQSITNAVRTSTKCQRTFPVSWQRAIALRGTESQAAEAERLIKQLDVPSIPNPPRND